MEETQEKVEKTEEVVHEVKKEEVHGGLPSEALAKEGGGGCVLKGIFWAFVIILLLVIVFEAAYLLVGYTSNKSSGSNEEKMSADSKKDNEKSKSNSANEKEETPPAPQPQSQPPQATYECKNTANGYSLDVPKSLYTKYLSEESKCMYFSSSDFTIPEVWDGPLTKMTVYKQPQPKPQVIETTVGELDGAITGGFTVNNGYESTYITGTFKAEGLLGGRKLYAVIVKMDGTNSLVFSSYDVTGSELSTFKELVKSVKLL